MTSRDFIEWGRFLIFKIDLVGKKKKKVFAMLPSFLKFDCKIFVKGVLRLEKIRVIFNLGIHFPRKMSEQDT